MLIISYLTISFCFVNLKNLCGVVHLLIEFDDDEEEEEHEFDVSAVGMAVGGKEFTRQRCV